MLCGQRPRHRTATFDPLSPSGDLLKLQRNIGWMEWRSNFAQFATWLVRKSTEVPGKPTQGQIQPGPSGARKQPTDCGSSILGSHSTTSGKKIVKAIATKNTT